MSSMAAPAAALPRPRTFPGRAAPRRLRSVPAQAGPVGQLEVGNPLQLTETMRTRLLAAVRALVSDPALDGAGDPARLAAVVLMAKAKVATNFRTTITATDLGRWVGLKPSRIAHHVLPQLRDRGVLGSNETVSAAGRVTGLECWVIPMYRAQHGGDRRHVLALSRVELVVLLALIEALFAPGWNHKDGRVTPAGMLADRTGRGAATDRLGLLLMVLSSNARGWLQLCSGSVDSERGRPAATVARLLGCSPAGGAKVLSRLQEQDVLSVDRRETASGLNARSRVRLLPVAQAHGIAVREAREAADAVFSDLAVTASGDHESMVEALARVVAGVQGSGEGLEADSADRADAAHLHASHASGVTPVVPPQLSCGFSGEGRGTEGRRPERACAGEDQPADGRSAAPGPRLQVAEDGPLRGEKPKKSPVNKRAEQRPSSALSGSRWPVMGAGTPQQRRRMGPPDDLRLRIALMPVAGLWERLSGWQQDQVEAAAKTELARLESLLPAPGGAPRLLAGRLTDRLEETGGEVMVTGPYGWLIRRGLVQRQACTDPRCDDGIRLDAATDCEMCANVRHMRRSRRAQICAALDQEQPGLSKGERQAVLESRMRRNADIEAQDVAWRREQAAEEEARRAMARAAAEEEAEAEVARAAAAVAEAVRQAQPCEGCGRPQSSGRCDACRYEADQHKLIREAEQLSAASVDPSDTRAVARAIADTRQMLDALTEQACGRYLQALESDASTTEICRRYLHALDNDAYVPLPDELRDVLAYTVRDTLQQTLPQIRASVLATLARSPEADTEAYRAYRIEERNSPYTGNHAAATAAAVAGEARSRTARQLLSNRLQQLRQARTTRPAARAPWSQRLAALAQRPLSDEEGTTLRSS